MRNIALLIEYDGTAYSGWQRQRNSNSIQQILEDTLSKLLQEKAKIIGAGRTDAGVHARGQVANFRTSCTWQLNRLTYALNGNLPEDIAILSASDVSEGFHSRYDAVTRQYSYTIVKHKSPLARAAAAFFPYKLSIENMNEAAAILVGKKSFKAFTKFADRQGNLICDVTKAGWQKDEPAKGRTGEPGKEHEGGPSPNLQFPRSPILCFSIEANRFLHGMVRAIVGTMIDVGRGKLSVEDFQRIINSEDRALASMSAPAKGLCLEEVRYGFEIWKEAG